MEWRFILVGALGRHLLNLLVAPLNYAAHAHLPFGCSCSKLVMALFVPLRSPRSKIPLKQAMARM